MISLLDDRLGILKPFGGVISRRGMRGFEGKIPEFEPYLFFQIHFFVTVFFPLPDPFVFALSDRIHFPDDFYFPNDPYF